MKTSRVTGLGMGFSVLEKGIWRGLIWRWLVVIPVRQMMQRVKLKVLMSWNTDPSKLRRVRVGAWHHPV